MTPSEASGKMTRFGYIRHSLHMLWERVRLHIVTNVREGTEVCEFDCRDTACDWEKWDTCKHRISPPTLPRVDRLRDTLGPGHHFLSATDLAAAVVGPDSRAVIWNVLVLGTEFCAPPMKRAEIHFEDPKQVPAVLDLLTAALHSSGFRFQALRRSGVPANEIWVTSPLNGGKEAVISCAAVHIMQWSYGTGRP